jgi:hypothetical protein
MSNIKATDDPTILLSCDQVYGQINFQDIENSGFFLAPNPSSSIAHPFKFNNNQTQFQSFHDPVDIWAKAEQTSP